MRGLEIRFDAAARNAGIQAADIARKLGISKQMLSAMKKSRIPGIAYWPAIARILKVDQAWLCTGYGSAPAWWVETTIGTVRDPDPDTPTPGRRSRRSLERVSHATNPNALQRILDTEPEPEDDLARTLHTLAAQLVRQQATLDQILAETQVIRSAVTPAGAEAPDPADPPHPPETVMPPAPPPPEPPSPSHPPAGPAP
jgi:hypothetical protein